ncbi:MAG: RRXRR domain-containing protein [Desulfovibrio sp.]|nr:RRXRR domain-containing protein [Desulfovibrio sp.]
MFPKDRINSEARFINRKCGSGWITPTVRQLIQTHVNIVKMVSDLVPIDEVAIELAEFAFMPMDDGSIMAHGRDRTFKMGVSVGMRTSMITLTVVRIIPAAFVEKGKLKTIIILLKPLKEAVIFRRI